MEGREIGYSSGTIYSAGSASSFPSAASTSGQPGSAMRSSFSGAITAARSRIFEPLSRAFRISLTDATATWRSPPFRLDSSPVRRGAKAESRIGLLCLGSSGGGRRAGLGA